MTQTIYKTSKIIYINIIKNVIILIILVTLIFAIWKTINLFINFINSQLSNKHNDIFDYYFLLAIRLQLFNYKCWKKNYSELTMTLLLWSVLIYFNKCINKCRYIIWSIIISI